MVPHFSNCLEKREQFSVSLRKTKKQQLLSQKRKRIHEMVEEGSPLSIL